MAGLSRRCRTGEEIVLDPPAGLKPEPSEAGMIHEGAFREMLRHVLMEMVEPPSQDLRDRVLAVIRAIGTPADSRTRIQRRWRRPR